MDLAQDLLIKTVEQPDGVKSRDGGFFGEGFAAVPSYVLMSRCLYSLRNHNQSNQPTKQTLNKAALGVAGHAPHPTFYTREKGNVYIDNS